MVAVSMFEFDFALRGERTVTYFGGLLFGRSELIVSEAYFQPFK